MNIQEKLEKLNMKTFLVAALVLFATTAMAGGINLIGLNVTTETNEKADCTLTTEHQFYTSDGYSHTLDRKREIVIRISCKPIIDPCLLLLDKNGTVVSNCYQIRK